MINHKNVTKKGFTLIEILIVIAIVAILAGVIFSFLTSARGGANDATIKSSLNDLRKEAELFANDNDGKYMTATGVTVTTACTNSSGVVSNLNLQTSFLGQVGGGNLIKQVWQNVTSSAATRCVFISPNFTSSFGQSSNLSGGQSGLWIILATLKSNPNVSWCVDSVGNSRQVSASAAGALNSIIGTGTAGANGTCNCGNSTCP